MFDGPRLRRVLARGETCASAAKLIRCDTPERRFIDRQSADPLNAIDRDQGSGVGRDAFCVLPRLSPAGTGSRIPV